MKSNSIVILTGAGISAESGIATFRDAGGLWEGHKIEDVATPEAFERNPVLVHEFYNQRRRQLLSADVSPNAAHKALARLEEEWSGDVILVTQNIDDLHERAGSHFVIHMHGELLRSRCNRCGTIREWREDLSVDLECGNCHRKKGLRPDIVWFGEMPKQMIEIERALSEAGVFVSIGTSGKVYPAAGFVEIAAFHGAKTLEINTQASDVSDVFDESYRGVATVEVPKFVERLLKENI